MTDQQTVNPDQLPEISAIPADLRALVASPGGPVQRVKFDLLLAKLIAASVVAVDQAALDADLAHDEHVVALIHSDADPLKNGWYRKTGASGAGAWVQFEELSKAVRDAAIAAADRAELAAASFGFENTEPQPDGTVLDVLVDDEGRIGRELRRDGTEIVAALEVRNTFNGVPVANLERAGRIGVLPSGPNVPAPAMPWEITAALVYGQSPPRGPGTVAITTTPREGLSMFGPQMLQGPDGEMAGNSFFGAPVPAVEQNTSSGTTDYGETPASAAGNMVFDIYERRFGSHFAQHRNGMFLQCVANGGSDIAALLKQDGKPYANAGYEDDPTNANWTSFGNIEHYAEELTAYGIASGVEVGIGAMLWAQGAAEYAAPISSSEAIHFGRLEQLLADLDGLSASKGQTRPILLCIVQNHSHKSRNDTDPKDAFVAEAEERLARTYPDRVSIVSPQYADLYGNGSVHPTGVQNNRNGKQFGLNIFQQLALKRRWWHFAPGDPVRVDDYTVELTFPDLPSGWQLVDLYQSASNPELEAIKNWGITIVQTGSTTELAQAANQLPEIEGNKVRLTSAAALPANFDIQIGSGERGSNLGAVPIHPADYELVTIEGVEQFLPRHVCVCRRSV